MLKGPNAAALYGSRAGNGVILVTTKKGSKKKVLVFVIAGTLLGLRLQKHWICRLVMDKVISTPQEVWNIVLMIVEVGDLY